MRFEATKHPARRGTPNIDMGVNYATIWYNDGTVERVIRKRERPGKWMRQLKDNERRLREECPGG